MDIVNQEPSEPTLREFDDHYRRFVAAYVARRISADSVDEIVAEVFVTAWRRWGQVPADALPWLYRTAHNVIGTRYRSRDRLMALHDKVASVPFESPEDPAEAVVRRDHFLAGLARLGEDDRELLLLVAWET